jgi:hypothetical protein
LFGVGCVGLIVLARTRTILSADLDRNGSTNGPNAIGSGHSDLG